MKMKTIRKYKNRKLYDVENSAYVTLQEISELIREGDEVQVIYAETGEDITAQTLLALIIDNEKRVAQKNLNNSDTKFLTNIIRNADGTFGGYCRTLNSNT